MAVKDRFEYCNGLSIAEWEKRLAKFHGKNASFLSDQWAANWFVGDTNWFETVLGMPDLIIPFRTVGRSNP